MQQHLRRSARSFINAGSQPLLVSNLIFFGKNVAPDGILRTRICTLEKAADRFAEGDCNFISLYDLFCDFSTFSRRDWRQKILLVNVGHGDLAVLIHRIIKSGVLQEEEGGLGLDDHHSGSHSGQPFPCTRTHNGSGCTSVVATLRRWSSPRTAAVFHDVIAISYCRLP